MARRFVQVDVFGSRPYLGNPVAVVLDASDLDEEAMRRLARWTNLSETTFILPPTQEGAHYRLRIFTPGGELPFAGHPTLGSAHAWLAACGRGAGQESVVQECAAGLIRVRCSGGRLSFSAPPLVRYEPVDETEIGRLAGVLGVERGEIGGAQWVDNGPGWVAVMLGSAEAVLGLRPRPEDGMRVGVVGAHPPGREAAFEVRAFLSDDGATVEDPVTGSLNASLARWLLDSGRAEAPYVASQGAALGRDGRVHVERDPDGVIWVGGTTVTCVEGTIEI